MTVAQAICIDAAIDPEKLKAVIDASMDSFTSTMTDKMGSLRSDQGRLVDQFAALFAALEYAASKGVLASSAWGTFEAPVSEACELALLESGLLNKTPRIHSNPVIWTKEKILSNLDNYRKMNADCVVDIRSRVYPVLDQHEVVQKVFIDVVPSLGKTVLAIKNMALLSVVFPGMSREVLKFLQSSGILHVTKKGSFQVNHRLRIMPGDEHQQVQPERTYLFIINGWPF